ncbi:MAG TPA: MFS transporter [Acetobacteraceae bacterium]|nr:MFS transporter [Acetobacteraceae bacterium]
MSNAVSLPLEGTNELRRYWPSVAACFASAVFGWGFGFTGTSVYLAELHRLHGWPNALIAGAITEYYLLGALCLTRVHVALRWLGPGRLLATGILLLGLGATLFSRSAQTWQLFLAAAVMACGWASCTSTAISSSLALYFQRQRGLAITLALNGASAAGFTVAPLLLALSQRIGVGNAVPLVALGMAAMVLPLIGLGFGTQPATTDVAHARGGAAMRAGEVLRTWGFWSIALPFALALAAQVGLIVHLVSFLLPRLGAASAATAVALVSVAAMGGRLVLATVIDRLNQRGTAAVSFASQAAGLGLMLAFPHQAEVLYAGCLLFGLSVGNVITFPALIVQREFPGAAFALVIGLSTAVSQFTFALAPAVLGIIRDATGGYAAVLATCIALQLGAATLVLCRRETVGAGQD